MKTQLLNASVRPMYTSDIKNRQHRSLLEHRWIGIGKSLMSMLSKIVVSLRPPNFHCHCSGWLPSNLTMSSVVFLGPLPENCPSLFCRAVIVM